MLEIPLHREHLSPVPGSPILPRDTNRTINLSSFRGNTYLQAMLSSGTGIFDKTDADDNSAVTIASPDQIISDINQFEPRVGNRLYAAFKNGQSDVSVVMQNIQGNSLSPETARSALAPFITSANLKPGTRANVPVGEKCPDYSPREEARTDNTIQTVQNRFFHIKSQWWCARDRLSNKIITSSRLLPIPCRPKAPTAACFQRCRPTAQLVPFAQPHFTLTFDRRCAA
jgi:hypothetical protein